LLGEGKIARAVCADINAGPLENAERNAKELGFADKITFVLTDGACGLSDMGITDYAVCGMGGELIAEIIDSSPHLKNKNLRLILQPMSRQAYLRRYLSQNGFSVVSEGYSEDAGKFYLCLAAEYDGLSRDITDLEAELGSLATARVNLSAAEEGYLRVKLSALTRAAAGKAAVGERDSYEARVLKEYNERTECRDC
jgi:tRNA (adenine22-N1)-methyltransferase